jgi:hypothetical protein
MYEEQEKGRVKAEEGRVESESSRVEAEAGRAHAESNEGSGRVESEIVRQETHSAYLSELQKLQSDPSHYMTPGARAYFRRVWVGYAVLGLAIVVGLWGQQREAAARIDDINNSRATITYTTCKDQNDRHDTTVAQLDKLLVLRKSELRKQIQAAETKGSTEVATQLRGQIDRLDDSRNSTVSLIDALAPHQNCEQLVVDRFGSIPE